MLDHLVYLKISKCTKSEKHYIFCDKIASRKLSTYMVVMEVVEEVEVVLLYLMKIKHLIILKRMQRMFDETQYTKIIFKERKYLFSTLKVVKFFDKCHIRSVLIGVEYQNCHRTLDVYLLFAILLGQAY